MTTRRRSVTAILAATTVLACSPSSVLAQGGDYSYVGAGDMVSVVGASALLLAPALFLDSDSITCVPCDRREVPVFDRWMIAPERPAVARVSDVLLIGIGVTSWLNLSDEGAAGRSGISASVQSLLWAEGTSELLKRVVGRKRPALYTPEGAAIAGHAKSQQSWPSGHAAGAAALAASYWLTRDRISSGGSDDTHAWVLAASAVGVAALRVAAAKHFPSDVVPGLVLGVLSAAVVHTVKF